MGTAAFREVQLVEKMPIDLKETFNEVIKFPNFSKARRLHSRVSVSLCQEIGFIYKALVLLIKVHWLSCGKIP